MKSNIYFGVGFLTALIICLVIICVGLVRKKDNFLLKTDYDERQRMVRAKGYKIAYFFLLISMFIVVCISDYVKPYLSMTFIVIVLMEISFVLQAVYCIVHDGYLSISESWKKYTVSFGAVAILNGFNGADNLMHGTETMKDSLPYGYISISFAVMFVILDVVLVVKNVVNKGEEEQ